MSRRTRLTIAAAVALISLAGMGGLGVWLATRGGGRAALPFAALVRPASAPFRGYRETSVDLGGRCRRVAVADTDALRQEGLRGHVYLGAYAGMLFVSPHDSADAFTMAGVTVPLEIGWYTADGAPVDHAHMAACPDLDRAHCPVYRSDRPYRLALETPGGSPAAGGITACG